MVYIRYNDILDHEWLISQLETQSIAEFVAKTGIPYNSVTNQVNQMPERMRARIHRGRLRWTEDEKRHILAEADKRGHSEIARVFGIAPAMLSRWRRELGIMSERPLKRGRPSKDRQEAMRA